MTLLEFVARNRADLVSLTLEHLLLVLASTGAAAAVGVPTGILLTRRPSLSRPVLAGANVLQTVPSLALFGFLIPLLGSYGIGPLPAIIALFLYSLLPIIRNTFVGIQGVDPAVREAARGLGMTDRELLTKVELPLALGVITAGVRVATVIAIGTATIAAAVGAGGLGAFIFRGLRMNDPSLVLAGAVPAALLALSADALLGLLERRLGPERRRGAGSGRRRLALALALAGAAAVALAVTMALRPAGREAGVAPGRGKVVVASKDFTEQVIVAEIVAQALERGAGLEVERRFELAGDLPHRALVSGEVDLYVEYTGTALMSVLKLPPDADRRRVQERVRAEYASRFSAEWLEPLGFDNTFAVLVRGEDARELGLRTISDLAARGPRWRAAFGQDFMSRADGWRGLSRTYGLALAEAPREMELALTYRALAGGQVDVIAGNSTDGLIDKLGLVRLEDDRLFFPPYEAAPVVRKDTLARHPEIAGALRKLAGVLTEKEMRRLNHAVDAEHRDVRELAAEIVARAGL